MKLWAKVILKHKIIDDLTIELPDDQRDLVTRVKEVMDEVAYDFDQPRPIWMKQNEEDLKRFGRTEFHQEHYIEVINFTKLEIELIDEDKQ